MISEGFATADRLWQCPLFHLSAVIIDSLTFRKEKKRKEKEIKGKERKGKERKGKERKRIDYTFRRHFNEKPSIIPGCPGSLTFTLVP